MSKELDSLLDQMDDEFKIEFQKGWQDELETMDISGLDAAELENLVHQLTARRLVDMLRSPIHCTPGLLQAALRFCKDNDITALPMPGSAQELLRKRIGDNLPFKPRLADTG